MTITPPILDRDDEPSTKHEPTPTEFEPAENSLVVWVLRLVSALIIPVVIVAVFFTFGYLKDEDANKALQVVLAIVIGTVGIWLLFWGTDRVTNLLPNRAAASVRPFVFVGPALVLLLFYLVYPAVFTLVLSLRDAAGEEWVGFDNYSTVFTERTYLIGLRNSAIWVLLVPLAAVGIGLAFATMADKLSRRAESVAKSLIFLPMSISFVGAVVVWTFIYAFRSEGFGNQIGVLNAMWSSWFGGEPVQWLTLTPTNNLFLMVILIWLQTGFSMVILSSAIKGVPADLLEAARIDGASEWQVFWRVIVPSIASTIVVVWTTVLITVWKVFDIVYVMTNGRDETQVVAQQMVSEFFTNNNDGIGAALAVVLFIAVVPILAINIRRFRAQEAMR
jgi:alpha-glucoside transport system permease protein